MEPPSKRARGEEYNMLTLRQCAALIKPLTKADREGYFLNPVDWQLHGLVDYPTIIQYPMDLGTIDIDFLTCSAHKLHGPKGVGFLYINPQLRIDGMIVGGGQERMLRGGTENVAGIVGLVRAFARAHEHMGDHASHVRSVGCSGCGFRGFTFSV